MASRRMAAVCGTALDAAASAYRTTRGVCSSSSISASGGGSGAGGGSNVAAIKELRSRTGAPMKDVKAMLEKFDWDIEAAMTELRKKGIAAASKKASRVAADGLLGLARAADGRLAAVVEVNSETDFVARNDLFRSLVRAVASATMEAQCLAGGPTEGPLLRELDVPEVESLDVELNHEKLQGRRSVAEVVAEVSAVTGEHVRLRRALCMAAPRNAQHGFVSTYLHTSPEAGLGRIAGLAAFAVEGSSSSSSSTEQQLQELGERVAMHAVAARPMFLSADSVPADVVDAERDVLRSQAEGSGKAAAVVAKMVEGRLRKFYGETVLLEQPFVMDDSKTVKKYLDEAGKALGVSVAVQSFLRVEVGQGIAR